MKLNKNGWGLAVEIIIILGVIVALVWAVYGFNKFGLVRNMNEALGTDILPDLIISGEKVTYSIAEKNLIDASKAYIKDVYGDTTNIDTTIKLSRLIKDGYISTIRDKDNNACSGYVMVSNVSENVNYDAYLKCDDYKTTGYNEEYDW